MVPSGDVGREDRKVPLVEEDGSSDEQSRVMSTGTWLSIINVTEAVGSVVYKHR